MTKLANVLFDLVLPLAIGVVLGYWIMGLTQRQSIIVLDANGNQVSCATVELRR